MTRFTFTPCCALDEQGFLNSEVGDVADFPQLEYSKRAVKRAGEVIAGNLPWTEENSPKIRDAFQIANNWRDAHAFPMRSIRYSVIWYMRKHKLEGITAARLKRMQAIRRKLRRVPENLGQLQDLGGCRVILSSIAEVKTLVSELRSSIRHNIRDEDDYISGPKDDGYRSQHIMFDFCGRRASMYDGRRIELQVRTKLQHSWATAVEAVGLFRGEDLKGHNGSEDWLRLFLLMSAEFAVAEGCPLPGDTKEPGARLREIKLLERKLDAVSVLDTVSHGIHGTDIELQRGYKPTHYLIRYDHATKTVYVEPYNMPLSATMSYDNAEALGNKTGDDAEDIVLVEVDKIENLKAAYPNYFGDVELFKAQLRRITRGQSAVEFAHIPRERPLPAQPVKRDLSWLRRSRFSRSKA
jgi:ppGpp synthetase/RelA/SpoT-type nucleotidyltranferase